MQKQDSDFLTGLIVGIAVSIFVAGLLEWGK